MKTLCKHCGIYAFWAPQRGVWRWWLLTGELISCRQIHEWPCCCCSHSKLLKGLFMIEKNLQFLYIYLMWKIPSILNMVKKKKKEYLQICTLKCLPCVHFGFENYIREYDNVQWNESLIMLYFKTLLPTIHICKVGGVNDNFIQCDTQDRTGKSIPR